MTLDRDSCHCQGACSVQAAKTHQMLHMHQQLVVPMHGAGQLVSGHRLTASVSITYCASCRVPVSVCVCAELVCRPSVMYAVHHCTTQSQCVWIYGCDQLDVMPYHQLMTNLNPAFKLLWALWPLGQASLAAVCCNTASIAVCSCLCNSIVTTFNLLRAAAVESMQRSNAPDSVPQHIACK